VSGGGLNHQLRRGEIGGGKKKEISILQQSKDNSGVVTTTEGQRKNDKGGEIVSHASLLERG